mmetsp:Transcript_19728/g.55740  ORF Transcript_19728/g.55740 Transcript_19728/m.55740 type:complete len:291 (+) Transcript_19728:777-1649(+)
MRALLRPRRGHVRDRHGTRRHILVNFVGLHMPLRVLGVGPDSVCGCQPHGRPRGHPNEFRRVHDSIRGIIRGQHVGAGLGIGVCWRELQGNHLRRIDRSVRKRHGSNFRISPFPFVLLDGAGSQERPTCDGCWSGWNMVVCSTGGESHVVSGDRRQFPTRHDVLVRQRLHGKSARCSRPRVGSNGIQSPSSWTRQPNAHVHHRMPAEPDRERCGVLHKVGDRVRWIVRLRLPHGRTQGDGTLPRARLVCHHQRQPGRPRHGARVRRDRRSHGTLRRPAESNHGLGKSQSR